MIPLGENEVVIRTFRKHWFIPALHTFVASLLFVIPVLAIFFLAGQHIQAGTFDVTFSIERPALIVFLISFWGLVLWLRFWSFWTNYQLDGWVLTNKRIIDVDQDGFFRRRLASFRLERLQDVQTKIDGILATFFRFGEVHAQTAGTDQEFVMCNAADPETIKLTILHEHDRVIESGLYKDGDSVSSPN